MISLEELMRRVAQGTDPNGRATLQAALQKLQQQSAGSTPMQVSPTCANRIEQAAAAVQSGDKTRAMSLMQEILSTPEGAALAQQLQFMMKK